MCTGRIPPQYAWLHKPGEIVLHRGKAEEDLIRRADAVFVLDLSDWTRLAGLEAAVRSAPGLKITVDHHPKHENGSDIYWRKVSASSVGEMMFELFGRLKTLPVSREVAIPLYVSLMTDTGCFRFSNSDVEAHDMASALIAAGVEPYGIYQKVYETSSLGRLRLLGHVLENLESACGGKLVWGSVSAKDIRAFGIIEEETEGIIDVIRTLAGVEVSVLFKEPRPGVIRISFRSASKVDVNKLAKKLGGGGHARAAGLSVKGVPLKQAQRNVLAVARRAVQAFPDERTGPWNVRAGGERSLLTRGAAVSRARARSRDPGIGTRRRAAFLQPRLTPCRPHTEGDGPRGRVDRAQCANEPIASTA